MHDGEFFIDDALVRHLVDTQFPQWSSLSMARVASSGTVHTIHRLGSTMAVRLPRHPRFTAALEREAAVLPRLAALLPLPIPEVIAVGEPTNRFPSTWAILRWIDGATAATTDFSNPVAAAARLAEFVGAMQAIDLPGETSPNRRGGHLAAADAWTRQSIDAVADEFDRATLVGIWESALEARPWDGSAAWIHGDLMPGNLIVSGGELSAVIDFGECAIGNPTVDLIAGWWVFDRSGRNRFREAAGADRDAWSRARGWALSGAVGALAYYRRTNRSFAAMARRTLREVTEDV